MKRIVIFSSGSGSNTENIINYFKNSKEILVTHVLSNNKKAKVFERCKRLKIEASLFSKNDFYENDTVLRFLLAKADFIVLAGFLWKMPINIIDAFQNRIINIHPALLPKFGGKGMYGMNVHKAVKEHNEKETGITIHYVNENYDEGTTIFQAKAEISPNDTPEQIANKVHLLEYKYFPKIIKNILLENE